MQAQRILETCVYAKNLDAAEEFYTRVLGIKAFTRIEGRHVFFYCGQGVFLVFNPEATRVSETQFPVHGPEGAGHAAFAMKDSEIDDWREHLKINGVAIETEFTWPNGGYSIYFRDPAGNSIELATPAIWKLAE